MYYNRFMMTFDCATSLDGIVTACITLQRAASRRKFPASLLMNEMPNWESGWLCPSPSYRNPGIWLL